MKVYLVMNSYGYDSERGADTIGVFSNMVKAKQVFAQQVSWAKSDLEEDWDFEETDKAFWAEKRYYSSRNWNYIWIVEREVK